MEEDIAGFRTHLVGGDWIWVRRTRKHQIADPLAVAIVVDCQHVRHSHPVQLPKNLEPRERDNKSSIVWFLEILVLSSS